MLQQHKYVTIYWTRWFIALHLIRNEITREKIVWTWKDYYFLGCSHHFFISIDISFFVAGSTQLRRGLTQQTGGSLLDDSQWHDVIIRRNHTKVTLVVDRLETHFETNGLFYRLNLDKKVRDLRIWGYIMGYNCKMLLIINLKCEYM